MKDISSGKCEEQKQTRLLSAIEVCTVLVASLVCVHTLSHLKDVLSCGETRTLTSMHVYHSRLSFASLTLIAVVLVDSSAATRYIGDPDVPIPQQDVLRRSTNRLYR